jgi:hypothetical protein
MAKLMKRTPEENQWGLAERQLSWATSSTGTTSVKWEKNTGVLPKIYDADRLFLKLHEAFKNQLRDNRELFQGKSDYELMERMHVSAELLIAFEPEKISLQLTNDRAVYYTVIKNHITLFFSHYLDCDTNDTDEVLLSIYYGKNNVLNYAGEMDEAIAAANNILGHYNLFLPALA